MSAWQFLCTILHATACVNLLFAVTNLGGLHRLLASLNTIQIRLNIRSTFLPRLSLSTLAEVGVGAWNADLWLGWVR